MVQVQPFRGWRYDLLQVGDLSEVTAPPYDVISPAEQNELYERHPCNVVRLILNREEPGDDSADERYQRVAQFVRHWQEEGILQQEREDALYVYHQEFDWEGRHYVRKGFLGRLRLEEFGKGHVYPHEQTMSGPKADRLALTKSCKMNLSPIFGLYPDDQAAVQKVLEAAVAGGTPLEATDDLGVVHRVWPINDHAAVGQVQSLLGDRPIFIADGHHRYETANNYRGELQADGPLDDAHPANFVLMMFVGMSDDGLAILPTHRLISGLPELTLEDLSAALGEHFECEQTGSGREAAEATWKQMEQDGSQTVFGFGTAADGQWLFARLSDGSPMAELAAEQSEAWRGLGVSILHRFVLDHLVKQKFPQADQACRYVHLMDEVTTSLDEGNSQLACLVAPAQLEHVEQIASKFEKMPPKSTYFYPKLLSGLVFHPLS